jgi:hypothetical protein
VKLSVYVTRRSGLLEPFEPPELTMDAAIERGWERHGALLEPKAEEYLPAYPMPGSGLGSYWWWGQGIIPWENQHIYGLIDAVTDMIRVESAPRGPLTSGLPEA